MKKAAAYVQWFLDGSGYRVTVYDTESQPLDEYKAGNHPMDSQVVAKNDAPLSDATLECFAEQTAKETADRWGVPHDKVSRDVDSERDYKVTPDA